jgi:DNA gyrase subunit A
VSGGNSDEQLELFATSTKTMGSKRRPTVAAKQSRSRGSGGKKPPAPPGQVGIFDGGGDELDASLQEETRRRYLSYALSVITSRALPDVRDGLKPVQRRILYAMGVDERLYPDAKHRKSAKVVGAVIGRYHPHGDTAVYDAMVRMAQDFSLRLPLVDGSGNFGSLDGDGAAAYRYTECRLAPPAMELLAELKQNTVPLRPNFDATANEPVVLPARYPNLLVNGSTGIAVGMATNIPPHNLKEVTEAAIALIDKRTMTTTNLLKYINGPDFPTGGHVLNSKVELRQIYSTGSGAIKVRAEYKEEKGKRGANNVIVTSIPYAVNKSTIVEKIAEVIIKRKVPQLVDVRDESTTDVRIVLELKKDADPAMVMAYLFKNTPLQQNFNVNLTCLFPTHNDEVGQPQRVGIKEMLEAFIDFRFEVTRKRFQYELDALRRRIHILEGFVTVFDALDQIIKIIRRSEGKKDAAGKIMKKFGLDAEQTDAILELKLYRLAKLEILVIREELTAKRTEANKISAILKSKSKLWTVVKNELRDVAKEHHTPRRTKFGGDDEEIEFDASAFIVDEDAQVVVTRDGWIKRQREVNVETTRLREGDRIMAVLPGSTKENVVFFSNYGTAYVMRIHDIPATSGYGDPAQKFFKFKDGERVVSAYTLDARAFWDEVMLAVSANGFGMRFDIEPFEEVTTRAGRRYARPKKGDEIIGVVPVDDDHVVVAVTRNGHVLYTSADQINHLEGPGKGVTVIKTAPDDRVIGFVSAPTKMEGQMVVQTVKGGKQHTLYADPKKVKTRGGKGHQIVKRSKLMMAPRPPLVMELEEEEE